MSIQRINIDQQFAQIGVRSSQARMQISTPKGQMRIQEETPQMQIETQMPRFKAPRQQINNESGLAGPLSFAKQFRDKGRREAYRATANYAADGDFITNPHIPGDQSIPRMMGNRMRRFFQKPDTNIGLIPSSPPSLDWEKGYIRINWSRHSFKVDWNGKNTADITVNSDYPVEVSISRQPSFRISSVEPAVQNRTMGRYIDRTT